MVGVRRFELRTKTLNTLITLHSNKLFVKPFVKIELSIKERGDFVLTVGDVELGDMRVDVAHGL